MYGTKQHTSDGNQSLLFWIALLSKLRLKREQVSTTDSPM